MSTVQRFSEVPDQLEMVILSINPRKSVTLDFLNAKTQFGDRQNVRYSEKIRYFRIRYFRKPLYREKI